MSQSRARSNSSRNEQIVCAAQRPDMPTKTEQGERLGRMLAMSGEEEQLELLEALLGADDEG